MCQELFAITQWSLKMEVEPFQNFPQNINGQFISDLESQEGPILDKRMKYLGWCQGTMEPEHLG